MSEIKMIKHQFLGIILMLVLVPMPLAIRAQDNKEVKAGDKAEIDILIYFPVSDFTEYFGFTGRSVTIDPAYLASAFSRVADTLPKMGYSCKYISDKQIGSIILKNGLLINEKNSCKALLLPGCKFMQPETFRKIEELADDGAKILVYENLPENVSPFAGNNKENELSRGIKTKLVFRMAGEHVMKAEAGKGKIIMGDNIGELMSYAGIRN